MENPVEIVEKSAPDEGIRDCGEGISQFSRGKRGGWGVWGSCRCQLGLGEKHHGARQTLHCQSATLTDISPQGGKNLIGKLLRNFRLLFRCAERALICRPPKADDTFPRRGKALRGRFAARIFNFVPLRGTKEVVGGIVKRMIGTNERNVFCETNFAEKEGKSLQRATRCADCILNENTHMSIVFTITLLTCHSYDRYPSTTAAKSG